MFDLLLAVFCVFAIDTTALDQALDRAEARTDAKFGFAKYQRELDSILRINHQAFVRTHQGEIAQFSVMSKKQGVKEASRKSRIFADSVLSDPDSLIIENQLEVAALEEKITLVTHMVYEAFAQNNYKRVQLLCRMHQRLRLRLQALED